MGIDIEELITRFDEIESLFSDEDAKVVEREGIEDNKELPAHRRARVLSICRMTKRELEKIKDKQDARVCMDTEEPPKKLGRYMGVAGTYE